MPDISRAAAGVPENHESVDLDGVRIAFEDIGAGPAIVCLHAAGHGGRDFELLRDRIRDGFRLIIVDWPGQGRSSDDKVPASGARFAQLLELFVGQLALRDFIVLGNSIGGEAAIRFAARRPEGLRALVLSDPGGLAPVNLFARVFCRAMAAFFGAGVRRAPWFRPAFSAYYKIVLVESPAFPQRERIVLSAYEIAAILQESWLSFSTQDADIRSSIEWIDCPVLFAWAKSDRVVSFGRSRKAVGRFKNAETRFFDGGHAPFLEDPDRFAQAFKEFERTLPPLG